MIVRRRRRCAPPSGGRGAQQRRPRLHRLAPRCAGLVPIPAALCPPAADAVLQEGRWASVMACRKLPGTEQRPCGSASGLAVAALPPARQRHQDSSDRHLHDHSLHLLATQRSSSSSRSWCRPAQHPTPAPSAGRPARPPRRCLFCRLLFACRRMSGRCASCCPRCAARRRRYGRGAAAAAAAAGRCAAALQRWARPAAACGPPAASE